MTLKQLIKEYVEEHYKNFGSYPHDVEVGGRVYSYDSYWSILEEDRFQRKAGQ